MNNDYGESNGVRLCIITFAGKYHRSLNIYKLLWHFLRSEEALKKIVEFMKMLGSSTNVYNQELCYEAQVLRKMKALKLRN